MLWLDQKYLGFLSSRLPLYQVKSQNPFIAVSRCVLCGDSQKNTLKRRAYFYIKKGRLKMKCHNCGELRTIPQLIAILDVGMKREYDMEVFKESGKGNSWRRKDDAADDARYVADLRSKVSAQSRHRGVAGLKCISQLRWDHPAKSYIQARLIPVAQHYRLYYAPKFFKWASSLIPEKFELKEWQKDEPRLVLPFLDREGKMFGFQGRSFDPDAAVRYLSGMIDEEADKIFGLDAIEEAALARPKVKVLEGPLDSLFLPNSLAMAGADADLSFLREPVIVLDNEPRNRDIVRRMEWAIIKDHKLVVWPDGYKYKDINDAVLGGMTPKQLLDLIDKNTVQGLTAELKLTSWRKC